MKKLFIIFAFIAATTSLSFSQDIVGDWNGKLTIGQAELRLVLHITKAADGSLTATLDSIDQGAPGIAVNTICLLYTSDAADDMQCVDLGGRRIIKKN